MPCARSKQSVAAWVVLALAAASGNASAHGRVREGSAPAPAGEARSIDGSGNHPVHAERNASFTPLARGVDADCTGGCSAPGGAERAGPREISNLVHDQDAPLPNPFGTSDYLWQWAQFLDHDLALGEETDPPGPVLNETSGWIDASNVYGSDVARARALRQADGTGRLRSGPGGLLPDADGSLPNARGGSQQVMFLAGDVRANEQLGLTALHTLFVREHNRLADRIRRDDPGLDGDAVYERARRLVGAVLQVVTYEEFLPALLGPGALPPYRGYHPEADARIRSEFATAAFRFGHSAVSPRLLRLDARLRERPEGHLPLREVFFGPDRLRAEGGIEPILRGLAQQRHQRIDAFVVDDARSFPSGPPGDAGFDLPALAIQRGRDHGLPSYNDTREAYGLPRATGFDAISRDPELQARLAAAYASVDDVDLWVGGVCEEPSGLSQLGPLFHAILVDQFSALRDGDRFWYERALDRRELAAVRGTRLADVIRRNTGIRGEIPDDVFRVGGKPRAQRPSQLRSSA